MKTKDMIMWNGMDIELFMKNHPPQCIFTALQMLEVLGVGRWEDQAIKALRHLVKKYKIGVKVKAKQISKSHKRYSLPDLELVVGVCPRCGNPIYVEFMRGCETRATGRLLLKICNSCEYYAEVFKKDDQIIEVEGD